MVCKPLDWTSTRKEGPRTLSDLSGGYFSNPTSEMYHRYRLLSSSNINNFYIDISPDWGNFQRLCDVMNMLQGQAFQINSVWLKYIQDNYKFFVEHGLLKPRFIISLKISDVSKTLRDLYMADKEIQKNLSYSEIIQTVCKDIQCARYEDFIFKLAAAVINLKLSQHGCNQEAVNYEIISVSI